MEGLTIGGPWWCRQVRLFAFLSLRGDGHPAAYKAIRCLPDHSVKGADLRLNGDDRPDNLKSKGQVHMNIDNLATDSSATRVTAAGVGGIPEKV